MPPGLALDSAGVKGKPEILSHMDMIVAAGGGERDLGVDSTILSGMPRAQNPAAFLNEQLMSGLRPTLFLAQLSNLLAGNISIVHGVTGSSRTFMGEEPAGVDAVRVALSRIASGQSDIALVGGAHNGERPDLFMLYEFGGLNLKERYAPVWERGKPGGFALGSLGAFLVLETRHACAGARGKATGAADSGAVRPQQTPTRKRRGRARPAMGQAQGQGKNWPGRGAVRRDRRRARDRRGTRLSRGVTATLPSAPPAHISVMGWSRNSP